MGWRVEFSNNPLTAAENMQRDADALAGLKPGDSPLLCFHHWAQDSISFGHFVEPSDYFDLEAVGQKNLDLARRPTGGGIVFHPWALSFSVIIPADHKDFSQNTLENYALVNRAVLRAVEEYAETRETPVAPYTLIPHDLPASGPAAERFCMAKPTKYDVIWQGKKIAGAAQRKTKQGFLHQGMISLVAPSEKELAEILLPKQEVIDSMRKYAWGLLPLDASKQKIEEARQELRKVLTKWITQS